YDAGESLNLNGSGFGLGALRNSSGHNTWAGHVTLATSASISALSSTTLTISGTISGSSSSTLSKIGNGTLVLAAANTYSGPTAVRAGRLVAPAPAALGATSAGTTVSSGAPLKLPGGIIYAPEPLTLNGAGASSLGALRAVSSSPSTWTGPIALASAATVQADAGAALVVSGAVQNGGYLLTVNAGDAAASGAGDVTFSYTIGGSGGLTKYGLGTLYFPGQAANT